ncbi:MAG: glycosyltransferase family 4 protein [Planctomycetota bacterium]
MNATLSERLLTRTGRDHRDLDLRVDRDRLAVTWKGAAFNYSGYARVTRELLPAVQSLGVPVSLETQAEDERFCREMNADTSAVATWNRMLRTRHRRGVHVCFHPAVTHEGMDVFEIARLRHPGLDAYAGYTMFETDRLPEGWAAAASRVDRLFTPSHFSRDVFIQAGLSPDRVRRLPHGIDWAAFDRPASEFPIRDRAGCVFLSVFEWSERKGWDVLLDAWLDAFTRQDDAMLLIRAYKSGRDSGFVRRELTAHLARRGLDLDSAPRIELVDRFVSDSEMPSLYRAADAFVLPTRGEGWGLPLMEAMGAGLPTIGTAWSGPLDFMDEDTALMIPVETLEAVPPAMTAWNPYYGPDHRWARPSRAGLAEHLRWVYERREDARALGARARRAVRRDYDIATVAELFARECVEMQEEADADRRRIVAAPGSAGLSRIAWVGPLEDRCGYAEEGRHYVAGLEAIGEPVTAYPANISRSRETLDAAMSATLDRARHGRLTDRYVTVQHLLGHQLEKLEVSGPTVARTMFECEGLPEAWIRRLDRVDEIWVPSEFNRRTFVAAGVRRPVRVIPEALDASEWRAPIRPLVLPDARGFNVLSVFDFTLRKGWDLLLRAWAEAFLPGDDVALYLKTNSSRGYDAAQLAAHIERFFTEVLGRSTADVPDIHLLDWELPSADLPRLYAAADCFCLPSRGEGWGRPYMESLAAGVPVIATDWGGSTEFLHRGIAELVPADVVPVEEAAAGETPYFHRQRWARPRHDDLVAALRRVHADPGGAREKAARGREEILRRFDREVVARQIAAAVSELLG